MTKALVKGSLQDIMQTEGKTLAESFLSCDAILIVDTSGSMSANDAPDNRMRHDAAQDELTKLQKTLPGKLAIVSFSSSVEFCPSGIPRRFNGGTDMAGALKFVQPADNCGITFYLITDGEPDSESDTLKVAKTFKSKINVIYIGPERGYGRDFLKRLANSTGGKSVQSDEIGMFADVTEQLLLTGG